MIDVGRKLRAVTPHDTNEVNCIAFFVGGDGDVAVVAQGDTAAVTLAGCVAGTIYQIACKKIMDTNTTATSIVAIHG